MPDFYTMSRAPRGPCGAPGKEVSLAVVKRSPSGIYRHDKAQDEGASKSAFHHGGHVDKVRGKDKLG